MGPFLFKPFFPFPLNYIDYEPMWNYVNTMEARR